MRHCLKIKAKVGQMAEWLRVTAVLPEDPSSVLSTYSRQFTTPCNSSYRSDAYLSPDGICTYTAYTHTDTYTYK